MKTTDRIAVQIVVLLAGILAASAAYAGVMPDPSDLSSYSQKKGETFQFQVTGSTVGSVWGTDLYTLDSRLAAAAVHAGILKDGEKGVVKVTILAGKQGYKGSSRNGVTSSDWGSYESSYKVEKGDGKVSGAAGTAVAPVNMSAFANKIGEQIVFEATGSTQGTVWGTDLYTLDSTLAAAAVHAGALAAGTTGKIKVTLLPGKPSYKGSSRNGVTSSDWGSYEGSYIVEKGEGKVSIAKEPVKPAPVAAPKPVTPAKPAVPMTPGAPGTKWYQLDPQQKYQADCTLKPGESRTLDIASSVPLSVGFKTDMTEKQVERNNWKNVNAIDLSTWGGAVSVSSWDKGELESVRPADGKISMKVENQGDIPVRVVIYTMTPAK